MKSLDAKKGEAKAEKAVAAEEKPAEKVDFSNVKIEPLFEEMVDFNTFIKSDFRAVKIEACEAVPKSKKLLKFTLNDGTDRKRTILSMSLLHISEPTRLRRISSAVFCLKKKILKRNYLPTNFLLRQLLSVNVPVFHA